jgi:hypothetical protein
MNHSAQTVDNLPHDFFSVHVTADATRDSVLESALNRTCLRWFRDDMLHTFHRRLRRSICAKPARFLC